MVDIVKRYKSILYVGFSFGILDLFIRFFNRGNLYISYIDPAPILFTISWILIYISILYLLKGKFRKYVYIIMIIIYNLINITNYIFIKIFGTAFSFNTMSLASEGSDYVGMIPSYIDIPIIIITIASFAFMILAIRSFPTDRTKTDFKVIIAIFIIGLSSYFGAKVALGSAVSADSWDTWMHKRNIYNSYSDTRKSLQVSGLFEYTTRDLYINTISKLFENNKEQVSYLNKYFSNLTEEKILDSYTGLFKNKNVIVILMESTDSFIVTKDKMPYLYKLMNESYNFTNHYSPIYGGGATFNTEYMLNTGYMTPLNEETAANQFGSNDYKYSLPNLFKNSGYTVNNFHENVSSFYNRKQISLALGYENYYSSIEMGITASEASNDTHFMTNSKITDLILPTDKKFMSFITTYTLHGPYKADTDEGIQCVSAITNDEKKAIANGSDEEDICLKAQAREADNFFKLLLEELEERDLINNTVIIGVTDHYAYAYNDKEEIYNSKGTSDDNLINKVPFFIWSNDIEAKDITSVSSNIDILPTIANLFALDYAPENYIGSNILSDSYKGYVFFKDYSWYDGTTYYKNGQILLGSANSDYIKQMNKKVNQTILVNKYVLHTDYFKTN